MDNVPEHPPIMVSAEFLKDEKSIGDYAKALRGLSAHEKNEIAKLWELRSHSRDYDRQFCLRVAAKVREA